MNDSSVFLGGVVMNLFTLGVGDINKNGVFHKQAVGSEPVTIPNRGNGIENVEILSLVVSNDWKVCIKWKWPPPLYIYIYIYIYIFIYVTNICLGDEL